MMLSLLSRAASATYIFEHDIFHVLRPAGNFCSIYNAAAIWSTTTVRKPDGARLQKGKAALHEEYLRHVSLQLKQTCRANNPSVIAIDDVSRRFCWALR